MKNALRPVRLQVYAVVLVCTAEQWDAVEKQFPNSRAGLFQGRQFLSRNFGTRRIVLLRCGTGVIATAAATQFAIDRWNPTLLMMTAPGDGEFLAIQEVSQINGIRIAEQIVMATAIDPSVPSIIQEIHTPPPPPAAPAPPSESEPHQG